MKDKPSPQQRILEVIELSGRGRDAAPAPEELAAELADRPELARLRERSKRLDDVLRRAVCDVPVPEGLQQRILLHLEQSAARAVNDRTSENDLADAPAPVRSPNGATRASRRWWIAASAGVVAASVLVAAVLSFWTSDRYTSAQVLREAVEQFVAGDAPPGVPLTNKVLASHPWSEEIRRLPNRRWRKVDGLLHREAVAYEMSAGGGTRATLFVLPYRRPIDGLGPSPPGSPQQATGGKAAGAWQADGMLYVLVVAGNERAYRWFLDPGRPLA